MDKKKIYISVAILILIAVCISVYFYFFRKPKTPDITNPADLAAVMQNLSDTSKNNFTDQKKAEILKRLSNAQTMQTPAMKKSQQDAMNAIAAQLGLETLSPVKTTTNKK